MYKKYLKYKNFYNNSNITNQNLINDLILGKSYKYFESIHNLNIMKILIIL